MRAAVLTDVGVVVEANIIRRVEEPRARARGARRGSDLGSDLAGPSASPPLRDVYYECEGGSFTLPQRRFHRMDVLPFGLRSPSEVFSTLGRHTSVGLVVSVSSSGKYRILPYSVFAPRPGPLEAGEAEAASHVRAGAHETAPPLHDLASAGSSASRRVPVPQARAGGLGVPPAAALTATPPPAKQPSASPDARAMGRCPAAPESEVLVGLRLFLTLAEWLARGAGGDGSAAAEEGTSPPLPVPPTPSAAVLAMERALEEYELRQLALPCALVPSPSTSTTAPVASPPHRIGSRVMARRFGCGVAAQAAKITAVHYDISYTVVYDLDGGVDVGVLHSDMYLLDDSAADPCTVRDIVTVTRERLERAVVIGARGDGVYRVMPLDGPAGAVMEVSLSQIVHVVPLLRDALWSDPTVVRHFRMMDPNSSGFVKWKDVRHLIMHSESYGLPLSFLQVGELQRDLRVRTGKLEPRLAWMATVQEEDMLLNFREFDYVVTRAKNMM